MNVSCYRTLRQNRCSFLRPVLKIELVAEKGKAKKKKSKCGAVIKTEMGLFAQWACVCVNTTVMFVEKD